MRYFRLENLGTRQHHRPLFLVLAAVIVMAWPPWPTAHAEIPPELGVHHFYEGKFSWPDRDTEQETLLILDNAQRDGQSNIVASGLMLYAAVGRFYVIKVTATFNIKTLRFELIEHPTPHPDMPIASPLVGTVTPDFKVIVNSLDQDSDTIVDFYFRARQPGPPPPSALARRSLEMSPSSVAEKP